MLRCDLGALATDEGITIAEHADTFVHHFLAPQTAGIDGCQVLAHAEHGVHVGYLGSVEIAQVQFGYWYGVEHVFHHGYILRIEVGNVKTTEVFAVTEHEAHVRHLAGVKVAHVEAF